MNKCRKLSNKALELWGVKDQVDVAVEEAGELIVALQQHFKRNRISVQELATEIADVEIMCDQLRTIIGDAVVDREKEFKLSRLKTRIDNYEQAMSNREQRPIRKT